VVGSHLTGILRGGQSFVKLDVHKSVHRDTTMKITNKMHYILYTTRYCKYSQVLLMTGENIDRNIYSQLGIIN